MSNASFLTLYPLSFSIASSIISMHRPLFVYFAVSAHNCILLTAHIIDMSSVSLQFLRLTLFSNDKTSDQINLFRSCFEIHEFTRLRSLTLRQISDTQLNYILQNIPIFSLVSLSMQLCERESDTTLALLSSTIARSRLRKLHLSTEYSVIEHISCPVQCTLEHLTISTCTYVHYCDILNDSPHLRTLVMRDCTLSDIERILLVSSASVSYQQLTSLTIKRFQLSITDLKSIISLTPLQKRR